MASCDQLKAQVEGLISTSQGYVDKAKSLAEQGKAATTVDQAQGIVSQLATIQQDNNALLSKRLQELVNQGSSQGCDWASLSSGYVEQVRNQLKTNQSSISSSYTAADARLARLQRELREQAAKPAPAPVVPTAEANANVVTPNAATTSTQNKSSDDSAALLEPVKITAQKKPESTTVSPKTADRTSTGPAATQTTTTGKDELSKPGRRLFNPLGNFPTYTYNISLYMITPKAYDVFVESGRTKLDVSPESGAVLIAQSGGINNATQTRAAGFTLDYYIDNLRITTATNGKDSGTSTNTTELEFTVTEPYGFSFISNLKAASDALIAKANDEGLKGLPNPSRQFFVLGIRFTGFKEDGTPASSIDTPLFERFYDIMLSAMTFKLDNKATVYSIKAASLSPGTAFGLKRGVWDTGGTLTGTTVYDVLQNMMSQMNTQAQELVKGKNIKPNSYKILFVDGKTGEDAQAQKSSPIFKSLMRSESEISKSTLIGNTPDKTGQRPAAADQSKPNTTANQITIPKGTPILQAFNLIISRSSYIEDAFKTIQTSALENNPKKTQGTTEIVTDNQNVVRWYNVSAKCENARFSTELSDYTWDITYVFTLYETPVVVNPYSNKGIDYYGPHKRYKYWFTGENSEILSYTQTLDNTFFNVAIRTTDQNEDAPPDQAQVQAQKPSDEAQTGTQNTQQINKKAYISSLFDPGAYANASMKIMGDPDYLMPETTTTINSLYSQFYGADGFTISPNGGQVFIEIDFKEPQDYGFKSDDGLSFFSTNDGLLKINDKIKFWEYQPEIDEMVEGVSYQVITVRSSFNQGKFEQDLQLVINSFPNYQSPSERASGSAAQTSGAGSTAAPATNTSRSGSNSAPAGSNQTSGSTLKQDPKKTAGSTAATTPNATAPPKTPKEPGG
jgi:hypothetical protein